MRQKGIFAPIGTLAAALLLALGLGSSAAQAASTVDVTYDLSDSTLAWESVVGGGFWPVANDGVAQNGTIDGSMKVRYASDSSSGMPILHGSATLLSFNLTAKSLAIRTAYNIAQNVYNIRNYTYLTGTLRWQLTTPVAGSLNSSAALTGLNVNLQRSATVGCPITGYYGYVFCFYYWGLPPSGQTFSQTKVLSGTINVAGSAGPNGGAQSTRHTLTGSGSAVTFLPGNALYGLGSADFNTRNDFGGAFLVGREVLREADGHDPKVIPEPGTLLLLGSGAAGLGLLGHSRRRARREQRRL